MKNFVILGVVVVLAVAGYFVYQGQMAPKDTLPPAPGVTTGIPEGATVVTLTKDGYVPDQLTIKKGDTITFKTTAGKMFWPASNLHPSHLLYPEFDPKAPIQADETWSFTFNVPGVHPFHDHLAPYFTGVITVTE